jgi:hypothetical protein
MKTLYGAGSYGVKTYGGLAKLSPSVQTFLDTCPAVISYREEQLDCGRHSGEPCQSHGLRDFPYVTFYYDAAVHVAVVPPGVWFDPKQMTFDEAIEYNENVAHAYRHGLTEE